MQHRFSPFPSPLMVAVLFWVVVLGDLTLPLTTITIIFVGSSFNNDLDRIVE